MTYIKARHGPVRFFRGAPQFLELKQLADLEAEFRLHCRDAIWVYRRWRREHAPVADLVASHYRGLEGALLRRQAEDAARLYHIIRKDMRRSFRKYIESRAAAKF